MVCTSQCGNNPSLKVGELHLICHHFELSQNKYFFEVGIIFAINWLWRIQINIQIMYFFFKCLLIYGMICMNAYIYIYIYIYHHRRRQWEWPATFNIHKMKSNLTNTFLQIMSISFKVFQARSCLSLKRLHK